ncbi:YIP1 family protein [bacterium]|nr:YIP1 family protein [bacterium]
MNEAFKPDTAYIISRARQVLLNPKEFWTTASSETETIDSVYKRYIIWLAIIGPVCSFLGMTFVGITIPFIGTWKMPFVSGFVGAIIRYAAALVMLFVSALVLSKLSPKHGGTENIQNSFRLVAYSGTAALLGGALGIIPSLGVLALLFGLYSIYTFYQGITPMTGVPEQNRMTYAALAVVCIVVIAIIFMYLSHLFVPTPPLPTFRG